jgi:hypothetical protein
MNFGSVGLETALFKINRTNHVQNGAMYYKLLRLVSSRLEIMLIATRNNVRARQLDNSEKSRESRIFIVQLTDS